MMDDSEAEPLQKEDDKKPMIFGLMTGVLTGINQFLHVFHLIIDYDWHLINNLFFSLRYTNNYKNPWGRSSFEYGITCRNMLTDPEITSKLKQKHAKDPYYQRYYGSYFRNNVADVGDIRYLTHRNNTILEMALAGSWISVILWIIVLALMVKERHHIKAHLTDESMWGSEFGGASRRSMGSRMSNQSFDKMSGSYRSGSRYRY